MKFNPQDSTVSPQRRRMNAVILRSVPLTVVVNWAT